ncbi:unnamed protein product, partial [Amoebophrya sp. A25]|eukprot:GSA25T00023034001.1
MEEKLSEVETLAKSVSPHQESSKNRHTMLAELDQEAGKVTSKVKLVALDVVGTETDDLERVQLQQELAESR